MTSYRSFGKSGGESGSASRSRWRTARFVRFRCRAVVASSASACSSRSMASTAYPRSEEHTSELQSQSNLVCRLLLEKKKRRQSCLLSHHEDTADPLRQVFEYLCRRGGVYCVVFACLHR